MLLSLPFSVVVIARDKQFPAFRLRRRKSKQTNSKYGSFLAENFFNNNPSHFTFTGTSIQKCALQEADVEIETMVFLKALSHGHAVAVDY